MNIDTLVIMYKIMVAIGLSWIIIPPICLIFGIIIFIMRFTSKKWEGGGDDRNLKTPAVWNNSWDSNWSSHV